MKSASLFGRGSRIGTQAYVYAARLIRALGTRDHNGLTPLPRLSYLLAVDRRPGDPELHPDDGPDAQAGAIGGGAHLARVASARRVAFDGDGAHAAALFGWTKYIVGHRKGL
jgi:hypothetical protein